MTGSTESVIRVAVVDDQPLLVSAFSALIEHEPDMHVVATGSDGEQAVALAAGGGVDVLVMDIRMPRLDGVQATRRIVERGERPRVLVLTTFNVDELVLGAVRAGARGFLLKDSGPAEVISAIRAIHRGEAVIASQAAPALLTAVQSTGPAGLGTPGQMSAEAIGEVSPADESAAGGAVAGLTARETEVLRLIAVGRSNAEIAQELFIAQTTVKTHVGNLLLKLDARDRVALVVLANSVGLVGVSEGRSAGTAGGRAGQDAPRHIGLG